MESVSLKDKNVKSLLCEIDASTKYACVKPFKSKNGKTVLNDFIEILNESNCKPNKLWVNQGKYFCNKLIQEWLDKNGILMYSTHNEGKSVIDERFIKILRLQSVKIITADDNKSYFPYLNKLADRQNNTYHHSINKKPLNVDYSAFTEKIETNPKAPKFNVNDGVRITKYSNFLSKGYTEIG